MSRRTICFYSPANLNNMDGSAIWIQAVAETLHVDPDLEITLPLRAMERRTTITGPLRRLDRVELLDPRALGRRGDVLAESSASIGGGISTGSSCAPSRSASPPRHGQPSAAGS
jgi:hypothetical protein